MVIITVSPEETADADVPFIVTPDIEPLGMVVPLGKSTDISPSFAVKAPALPKLKDISYSAASSAMDGDGATDADVTCVFDWYIV